MMGRARRHGRSERDTRQTPPSGELHSLEHVRAPWFFDAEFQRRLRTGDKRPRQSGNHPLRIAAVSAGLLLCLALAYFQFADRVWDPVPAPAQLPVQAPDATPVMRTDTTPVTRIDSAPAARTDTARIVRPESVTVTPVPPREAGDRQVNDTLRATGDRRAGVDTARQPASGVPGPAPQESRSPDSTLRREPPPSELPRDTTVAPPDSTGRREGAP